MIDLSQVRSSFSNYADAVRELLDHIDTSLASGDIKTACDHMTKLTTVQATMSQRMRSASTVMEDQ